MSKASCLFPKHITNFEWVALLTLTQDTCERLFSQKIRWRKKKLETYAIIHNNLSDDVSRRYFGCRKIKNDSDLAVNDALSPAN